MSYYMTRSELYHHGILGMKWGVRRFQNADGSLTEAGQKRYNKLAGKIAKEERKIEKYQKRVDRNAGRYYRAERKAARANRLQNRAARLHNKAVNGLFINDTKRAKLDAKSQRLSAKADRLSAKAARMQNRTKTNVAKIRRAQSHINKYARKIAKFAPQSTYAGAQYINGFYQKKLSDF